MRGRLMRAVVSRRNHRNRGSFHLLDQNPCRSSDYPFDGVSIVLDHMRDCGFARRQTFTRGARLRIGPEVKSGVVRRLLRRDKGAKIGETAARQIGVEYAGMIGGVHRFSPFGVSQRADLHFGRGWW